MALIGAMAFTVALIGAHAPVFVSRVASIMILAPNLALIRASHSDFGFHWGSNRVAQIWALAPTMAVIGALALIFAFIGDPSGALAPNSA